MTPTVAQNSLLNATFVNIIYLNMEKKQKNNNILKTVKRRKTRAVWTAIYLWKNQSIDRFDFKFWTDAEFFLKHKQYGAKRKKNEKRKTIWIFKKKKMKSEKMAILIFLFTWNGQFYLRKKSEPD